MESKYKLINLIYDKIFNLNFFFLHSRNTCNVKKQLYLIECFNKLIDESNISYTEVLNQEKYMIIKCVYALKNLGFNITLQKFENVDKMQFLTTIWKSHANKEKGIEVMSYICLGYNIFIPQIWNGILKQMIKLNMVCLLKY